jgi:hypothetical protein
VQNASTLLQTWTRILSQTEHNQRLILNPQWQGASQDLVAIEEEEMYRQQAAERRAAEDQAKREAAARKMEEERRRAEAPPRAGTRGRGRGHEAAEHLLQPPQREATLELAGRLEEASVAAAQQVVELAAASDGAYEEEAEV